MTALGIYQILFFFLVILALTKPLGMFMARVFEGERTFLHPVLRPLEVLIYKLSRRPRGRRAALDGTTRARCSRSASPSSCSSTRSSGSRAGCR